MEEIEVIFANLKQLLSRVPSVARRAPTGTQGGLPSRTSGNIAREGATKSCDHTVASSHRYVHVPPHGESEPRSGSVAPAGTLVRAMPDDVKEIFANLPDEMLLSVAQFMAELAPLRPVPHWHFGDFINSSNLAVHVRHALWQTAKNRSLEGTIRMPWHGGTKLNMRLGHDLSLVLFVDGRIEPNEFVLLDRILLPGMVFLDAGANEGIFTLFASTKVGTTGRVVAVEPSPRELVYLRENLRLNNIHNTDLVEQALAERSGTLHLRLAEGRHSGLNTLGDFAYPEIKTASEIQVSATTIDEMVRSLQLTNLDVIKLDLEGAEIRALMGAPQSLQAFKPLLLIEALNSALEKQNGSVNKLLDLLETADYSIFVIDDETGMLAEFERWAPLSSNIVATHRERPWNF